MQRTRTPKEEAFWQRLVLPQEDRDWLWDGIGYRWFRSPNVVALEHYRRPPDKNRLKAPPVSLPIRP